MISNTHLTVLILLSVPSEDQPLVDILAALAEDNAITATPEVVNEIAKLEEQDSVLSQVSQPRSQEVEKAEKEEELEMSQRIWDGHEQQ